MTFVGATECGGVCSARTVRLRMQKLLYIITRKSTEAAS